MALKEQLAVLAKPRRRVASVEVMGVFRHAAAVLVMVESITRVIDEVITRSHH